VEKIGRLIPSPLTIMAQTMRPLVGQRDRRDKNLSVFL
jgi:hypothetical protein